MGAVPPDDPPQAQRQVGHRLHGGDEFRVERVERLADGGRGERADELWTLLRRNRAGTGVGVWCRVRLAEDVSSFGGQAYLYTVVQGERIDAVVGRSRRSGLAEDLSTCCDKRAPATSGLHAALYLQITVGLTVWSPLRQCVVEIVKVVL